MSPGVFYIKDINYFSSLSFIKASAGTFHCIRVLVTMLLKKLKKSWIKSKWRRRGSENMTYEKRLKKLGLFSLED